MKNMLWLILGGALLMLLCGCPVEEEAPPQQGGQPSAVTPPDAQTPDTPPAVEETMENPCGDAEEADGEAATADGEEGENPCAEAAEGEENPCGENPCTPADESTADPNVTNVVLETSKGDIVIAVHKDWSPLGAAHYIDLVNASYYDGAPWFRVISGFMCQCGVAADPAMTAKWKDRTIQDEPVVKGNQRGFVSFGRSGMPNSRSTHFFINYADNSSLDSRGFPAFGEVIQGMEVADSLFVTGENPPDMQSQLTDQGVSYFKQMFPEGDVIKRAYVQE